MSNVTSPNDALPPVPQHVTSERLLIRPSTRADASYLQKWWNDPNITTPGGNMAGMQYDNNDMEDWFRRYVDGRNTFTHFVICLHTPEKRPIGEFYIASDDRPGCVDIALIIGEMNLWGQGYARETLRAYVKALFASGCCSAVRMDMRRDNDRAIRMCTHVGFEIEHIWANNQFQTMILTQEAYQIKHSPAQAG